MGITLLKIKIMPSSPSANLEKLKKDAQRAIEEKNGKKCRFEEEPIAFGLKAIICFFEIDENQELEPIEEKLKSVKEISSIDVLDMRRAFG